MAGPKVKLFFSLFAVALNVVGAPMASAHMANMDHGSTAAMPGMEHCNGHRDTGTSEPDSSPAGGHLACCKGGVCSCGCLHAISVLSISTISTASHAALAAVVRTVPASNIEDPLRPPIT